MLWKASLLLAQWLSSTTGPLLQHEILNASTNVLELGCGVSPIVGLALADKVHRYIATDQPYVRKLIHQNIEENSPMIGRSTGGRSVTSSRQRYKVEFLPLDWELDSAIDLPNRLHQTTTAGKSCHIDVVIACDCIYNDALVDPFVDTCADVCRLNTGMTICLVAQQLRSPEVFEKWLKSMLRHFRVWRMAQDTLSRELSESSGFVVHMAILADKYETQGNLM